MSDGFEMTTGEINIPLTGRQKAAILFAELGVSGTKDMLEYFSSDELKKLRKSIENLPPYNPAFSAFPKNQQKEIKVLEEVCRFGVNHKYLPKEVLDKKDYGFVMTGSNADKQNSIIKQVVDNPDTISKVLRTWLGED